MYNHLKCRWVSYQEGIQIYIHIFTTSGQDHIYSMMDNYLNQQFSISKLQKHKQFQYELAIKKEKDNKLGKSCQWSYSNQETKRQTWKKANLLVTWTETPTTKKQRRPLIFSQIVTNKSQTTRWQGKIYESIPCKKCRKNRMIRHQGGTSLQEVSKTLQ